MIEHVRFEHTTYNTLPYKFEAGTPNFIGSHAFAAALDYIDSIGMPTIQQHEAELTAYAEQRLKEIPNIRIYAETQPKTGVISFNIGTIHPFDVGTLLDHMGIAVRTGHHCAEPLIDYLQVPGTIRASFGLYNDKADIDTFIAALNKAVDMLS